jgi:type I restriction enzyme S subunit
MRITRAKIGDACIVGDGAHGSLKRWSNGILYLTSKNLKDGKLELSKVEYIDEPTFAKFFREGSKALTVPGSGDVIFGIIGSIGEAYLVNKGDRFGISSSIAILRPNRIEIDAKYLYHWVKGQTFQQALYAIKGGVAQAYVSLEMIRSLPLNYPDLIEQQKIAAILSGYDDLIENNTRRIQILEEMARRIYEEWFVRFRFPGHENVRMVESELGLIPDGWKVQGLYDVSELTYGFPFKSKLFNSNGGSIGIVRIRDIRTDKASAYTDEKFDQKYLLSDGDLLIGMDGEFHMGRWAGGKAALNQRVVKLRPKGNLPTYFLFLLIENPIKHLEATIVGTTVAHLSAEDLKNMKLITPSNDVLKVIRPLFDSLFKKEIALKKKNQVLRRTRDFVLPKLISGEIDVSNFPEPVTD